MVGLIPSGLARSRGFYPHKIDHALRLNAAESPGLTRTPGSAGDRKTWEIAVRAKVTQFGSVRAVYAAGTVAGGDRVWFDASDKLNVAINGTTYLTSSGLFRDPSSHYAAIRVIVDTTQATAADRITVEVNDAEITAWDTDNRGSLSQNTDCATHSTVTHYWGRDANGNHFDGYFSEAALVDGGSLAGYVSTKDGTAIPSAPNATWGANGVLLDFADAANLGKDVSGNGNDFAENNITSDDQVEDTPTNNHPVFSSIFSDSPPEIEEAGMFVNGNANKTDDFYSLFGVETGKWYFEYEVKTVGFGQIGVARLNEPLANAFANGVVYRENGVKYVFGTGPTSYGTAFNTDDIVSVVLDMDNGTINFWRNGTDQGEAANGLVGELLAPLSRSYSQEVILNGGQLPFAYTPPTGFKALNAANLPKKAYRTSGSYDGNGSSDGPVIYSGCAFSEVTIDGTTYTNDGSARGTIDFLANGFKLRSTTKNGYGATYNWSGVVSQDFKYANAQVN